MLSRKTKTQHFHTKSWVDQEFKRFVLKLSSVHTKYCQNFRQGHLLSFWQYVKVASRRNCLPLNENNSKLWSFLKALTLIAFDFFFIVDSFGPLRRVCGKSSDENLRRFKRKMTKGFVMGITNESTVNVAKVAWT